MMLRAATFILFAFLFTANANAVFIDGDLSTDDSLGANLFGESFYLDLYTFTVDVEMEVELFVEPQDDIELYLAYWDGDFSATPNWFEPPPIQDSPVGPIDPATSFDLLYIKLLAMPGINYQMMVSSWNFNSADGTPPPLGNYFAWITTPPIDGDPNNRDETGLNVDGFEPFAVIPVHSPASILLFGVGFVALGLGKRNRYRKHTGNPVPL